jgi:hypothetical protein
MKCIKDDCKLEAKENSNYCERHQPKLKQHDWKKDEEGKKIYDSIESDYRRIKQSR